MKIAFDAKRVFQNSTGLGNYSRTLLDNLKQFYPQNDYLLFASKTKQSFFKQDASVFPIFHNGLIPSALWRSYFIKNALKKAKANLYHGLSNEIPFGLKGLKSIVTIHDLIFKILPNTYPRFDRIVYDKKAQYACKNADYIIAISENTKKDIIKYYGISPSKIQVIYQACDPIFYIPKKQKSSLANLSTLLPKTYLLSVGSIIERKNLLSGIQAIQSLPKDLQLPLVVVGRGKSYKKKIQQYLYQNRIEKMVIWLENINNIANLKYLYQNAQLFLYPSVYEGFGLPVAEALLCKTPVITSSSSALPEAGGANSKLVDPQNVEEIADAIAQVLVDPQLQKNMAQKGFEYAHATFKPKALSHQMMDLYKSLIA